MGIVVHFEFSVPDPEKTAAFYRAAFGWVATKLPDPLKYWQFQTPQTGRLGGLSGGIVESKTGEGIYPSLTVHAFASRAGAPASQGRSVFGWSSIPPGIEPITGAKRVNGSREIDCSLAGRRQVKHGR